MHAREATVIVATWGTHGAYRRRNAAVRALIPELHCLRLTKGVQPAHPLYLPRTLQPVRWTHFRFRGEPDATPATPSQ